MWQTRDRSGRTAKVDGGNTQNSIGESKNGTTCVVDREEGQDAGQSLQDARNSPLSSGSGRPGLGVQGGMSSVRTPRLTPKANKSVELIFDYVGGEMEKGLGEGGGGGVENGEERDPAFRVRRKTKVGLLRFGRRNKRAFEPNGKDKDIGKGVGATPPVTPSSATSASTKRSSRRSVYGDGFQNSMPHIGETLLEHQKRMLVPILLRVADNTNGRLADNSSTLISDAMHLRNVNSHRWNSFALKFYKARNSRAYHVFMFLLILAHTVLTIFEAPRGEWEHVTDYLKLAEESVQTSVCSWVNGIIVTIYFLDVVIQMCYQRMAWHEVDWASDYVKNRGCKNVESTARSFRRNFVSSLRESSFGADSMIKPGSSKSFFVWVSERVRTAMKLKYNSIFIINALVVAFLMFATATNLPSKGAFFRPTMFLFMNYRIQTACGAFLKMLPHLTDILVIIFLFIIAFAGMTCLAFDEAPGASSSNPQEGYSSFWYALLNYYVLLSTENFPSILDRFNDNFVAWAFITFLVLGYFIFMAYLTAIVFDGYYDVKIQISLQEYLTERSALVTAFLCIAYDPLCNEFNDVLTLGDLLEANLTFHGHKAGIEMITELFLELDMDGSKTLDEDEFYHFCDAVVSQLERLEVQELGESFHNRSSSSFDSAVRTSSVGGGSDDQIGQRRRSSLNQAPMNCFKMMSYYWRRLWSGVEMQLIDFFDRYVDKLVPEEGTHILFNHILQIFRSGLIQIFFILALIWNFAFALIAMNVLGKKECINRAIDALGEDVDEYVIPYYERFDTFPNSMLAMFRLATGSGWNDVMFLYWPCETPWGGTNFAAFFFVTFHFSFCIVFYNVLGGLIFAHYKQLSDGKGKKLRMQGKRKKRQNRKSRNKKRKKTLTGSADKRGSILRNGGRRASQIPEMRQSARFWREALEKEGGNAGGGGGNDMTMTGGRASSNEHGVGGRESVVGTEADRDQGKKMQKLYEKHMHMMSTHLEARELLGTNPYASRTLNDMAERLIKPASGLQWDMTVINSKHVYRSDSGSHASDSRVRTSSVDSAIKNRTRSRSTSAGTNVSASAGADANKRAGSTTTVESRRSSWLMSMGVTSKGKKGKGQNFKIAKERVKEGGRQNQENSGHTLVGIEMKEVSSSNRGEGSCSEEEEEDGDDEEEDDEEEESYMRGKRGYRRSFGRRQLSDVFL